jgi:hypothetical protein
MKYTLVVGIAYKKYKNASGDIAVYVGGRLIDAFQIDQDVTFVCQDTVTSLLDETWYRRLDRVRWLARLGTEKNYNEGRMTHELVPKLFKIYEIEEQDLNGLVEIKVDNSHNDYNNGFIKNNSMIRFPMIGLFPSHFAENRGEQLMRIIKKIDDARNTCIKRKSKLNFRYRVKTNGTWPFVDKFYIRRQSETFEKNGSLHYSWWIGGSFTAEIPIKTKHRIRYLVSQGSKEVGFFDLWSPVSLILATCKQLLNIYNEDQRSNRTKD